MKILRTNAVKDSQQRGTTSLDPRRAFIQKFNRVFIINGCQSLQIKACFSYTCSNKTGITNLQQEILKCQNGI